MKCETDGETERETERNEQKMPNKKMMKTAKYIHAYFLRTTNQTKCRRNARITPIFFRCSAISAVRFASFFVFQSNGRWPHPRTMQMHKRKSSKKCERSEQVSAARLREANERTNVKKI